MPVFKSGLGQAPDWCEMVHFEIVDLPVGATHHFDRIAEKEKLIVGRGECRVAFAGQEINAAKGANLDLTLPEGEFRVLDVSAPATLVRMCGHWGTELGGSGLFTVVKNETRQDRGDPVAYAKETGFDSHYHDCDEYWIVYQGHGVAVTEGQPYQVGPGDCIATRMGDHHDFPRVSEPVHAVYMETTLRGQKRRGHLWEHAHGPARPQRDQT
jgi:mannose-6-phosphate isomerase-like protein (cupin superfamily)